MDKDSRQELDGLVNGAWKYATLGDFLLAKASLIEAQNYASKTGQEIPWETHTEILETVYRDRSDGSSV